MEIDPATVDEGSLHRTLTSLVAPRPIGWVSSKSADGEVNLAPYSYFNAVCTHPPVVMFSAMDTDDGTLKDTPSNVLETEEFVVNIVTKQLLDQVDRSGATVDPDVNEFEFADIDSSSSQTVDVPRVTNAPAHLECVLLESHSIHNATTIFGDVQHVHVDDSLCTDGSVDALKIDSIGRLGGPYYTGVDPLAFHRGDG